MNIKELIKTIAHKTVLRNPHVRHCSQTIYEALLGCLRMWDATGSDIWKERSDKVLAILLKIQRPDGGFDIGYDFNFGMLHRKGESTSPELVGLVALAEYARIFGPEKVSDAATRAANWIGQRAIDLGGGKWAIPYGPYSCNEVMVYNGTSFASGALGRYLGFVNDDQRIRMIYEGMCKYLEGVLSTDSKLPGRFWYYNDQSREDLSKSCRIKIDYYHQMQQVEMHSLAQQAVGVDLQLELIRDAADLVVELQNKHEILPYYNKEFSQDQSIHSWGLSSVIPGMLEAAQVIPERKEAYCSCAREVLDWMVNNAWNNDFFFATLDSKGNGLARDYMVRSDAWVFNAFGAAAKYLGAGPWNEIAEKCYLKMESVDFSGPETHASTKLARFVTRVISSMIC